MPGWLDFLMADNSSAGVWLAGTGSVEHKELLRENESEDLPVGFIDGGILTVKEKETPLQQEAAAPGQRLEEVRIIRGPQKCSGLLFLASAVGSINTYSSLGLKE